MRYTAGEKHKICLILCVMAALLAGCSRASTPGIDHPTLAATGAPGGEASMPPATATAKPGGIKVNPPKLPVEPGPGALPAGWQTYTSPALGVAVDYPQDWPVAESGARASFTSPQGVAIVLEGVQVRPTASPAGQDCTEVINASGLSAETCFDAASSRYSAVFKMPAGAPTVWLVLSTISKEKPVVYLQMFASLRALP